MPLPFLYHSPHPVLSPLSSLSSLPLDSPLSPTLSNPPFRPSGLLLLSALYWLFFLSLPLLGYAWFFSWHFVDTVATTIYDPSTAAAPPPFSALSAAALGVPFATCVYLGCFCGLAGFTLSTAQFVRHLHLLNSNAHYRQEVFVEARRAQAAQAAAATNSPLVQLVDLFSLRSPSAGGQPVSTQDDDDDVSPSERAERDSYQQQLEGDFFSILSDSGSDSGSGESGSPAASEVAGRGPPTATGPPLQGRPVGGGDGVAMV